MADDLYPPEWRGLPGSTLQIWEFTECCNPAPAEIDQNPFGTAELTVYGEFAYPYKDTWWIDDELEGHQGVWNVGGSIGIYIPNDPTPNPYKFIRLQITYDGGHAVDPSIPFSPWVDVEACANVVSVDLVQETPLDAVFTHAVYDIVLEPNPVDETVWIVPRYCQLYVDEIVIDTICIPEPATMGLLAIGAGATVLRRKRK